MADALDLGSSVPRTCRFDSCHPHLGFYRVKSIHAVRAFFYARKKHPKRLEVARLAVLSNKLAVGSTVEPEMTIRTGVGGLDQKEEQPYRKEDDDQTPNPTSSPTRSIALTFRTREITHLASPSVTVIQLATSLILPCKFLKTK